MSVRQVGRVLECEARGPLNVGVHAGLQPHVAGPPLAPWAGEQAVVVYTRWTHSLMATPDALAYYDKVMAAARAACRPGRSASGACRPTLAAGPLPRWQAIMAAHGHPLEVVDNDAEGRKRACRRCCSAEPRTFRRRATHDGQQPAAFGVVDAELAPMRWMDFSTMARPRPAPLAAVRAASPVEGRGQARQAVWGHAGAVVAHLRCTQSPCREALSTRAGRPGWWP